MNQIMRLAVVLLASLLTTSPLFATISAKKITHYTNKIKQKSHAHIGILIAERKPARLVYSRNADQYFIPASTLKLFTAAAALTLLKPTFTFATTLYYLGKQHGNTLDGDIALEFSGDPSLTLSELQSLLLTSLNTDHIERLHGDIYLINDAFDQSPYPPGMSVDDLTSGFGAPVSTINLNENQFVIQLSPRKNSIDITTDVANGAVTIDNQLQLIGKGHYHCPLHISSTSNNNYRFEGCIRRSVGTQSDILSLRNTTLLLQYELPLMLKTHHISFTGDVIMHTPTTTGRVRQAHHSIPLHQLVMDMLKDSDNLISNCLLKKMGQVYFHQPGSWRNGVKALEKTLAPITGINFNTLRIKDGAGLSRYNLVTPRQLYRLIRSIQQQPILQRYLIPALPIAGIDGTLAHRMKRLAKKQQLQAKTGTLTGISNLAGYIKTKKSGDLLFVLMSNGYLQKAKTLHHWQNTLCQYLAQQ